MLPFTRMATRAETSAGYLSWERLAARRSLRLQERLLRIRERMLEMFDEPNVRLGFDYGSHSINELRRSAEILENGRLRITEDITTMGVSHIIEVSDTGIAYAVIDKHEGSAIVESINHHLPEHRQALARSMRVVALVTK